jgi:hypothetical protein
MKSKVNIYYPKRRSLISSGLAMLMPFPLLANELRDDGVTDDQVRRSLLSFLATRRLYGVEAQKQLLNGIKLELWDISKKIVFFSAPQNISNLEVAISQFTINVRNRQDSKFSEGRNVLLGKSIARTAEKYYLFAIDESNFRILNEKTISIKFDSFNYSIQAFQLAKVFRNNHIYGGALRVRKTPEGVERPTFLNHGAMVSMPGEPAIEKLCGDLVAGTASIEEKYQRVLDFVTNWIEYDESDFYFGREFLQRANETLIGKIGDCSNKVILYASLLEQISLPYVLIYSTNHIAAAVPKGVFDSGNGYDFSFKSKNWTIAETTVRNFKIGITKIKNESNLKAFKYVQNPSEKNRLFDYPGDKLIIFG